LGNYEIRNKEAVTKKPKKTNPLVMHLNDFAGGVTRDFNAIVEWSSPPKVKGH